MMRKNRARSLSTAVAALLLVGMLTPTARAASAVPGLINFQGRLLDSDRLPRNGTFSMAFRICDALAAGSCAPWTETQNVIVTNGVFSVQLGAVTPVAASVFTTNARYLEIEVGGEILSPRERLVGSPYAFRCEAAESLVGFTVSRALVTDGSGNAAVSAVTSTELGYMSGVTSAVQTQIASKQATITGAATTITSGDLTVNRVVVSDGSGKVSALAAGNAGEVLKSAGASAPGWGLPLGIPNNIQVFTGNGTWTKPANVSMVYVQVWGAGGGGGTGGANASDGGGGGGGYTAGLVSVSADVTVTVGSGGTSNGGNGGLSRFAGDSTLTANGGSGTTGATGGNGGTASGGTINLTGQKGGNGLAADGAGSGNGGAAPMGGGGGQGQPGGNAAGGTGKNGDPGQIPGGGGGGGAESNGTGGAGADGLVIVMY